MRILILHGPNLNLLGRREPETYGSQSLESITAHLDEVGRSLQIELASFQANSESELIERLHASMGQVDGIVLNPAAFTHTSVALRDAILAVDIPFVEVHLSNVYRRESFRRQSYFSDIALGVISGLGASGYEYGLRYLALHLKSASHK